MTWKFALNYVPTLQNLYCKSIVNNQVCPCCHQYIETTLHVSRDCLFARQVRQGMGFQWPATMADMDFMEWLRWIFKHTRVWERISSYERSHKVSRPVATSRWAPPPLAWVKINVDTGYSGPTNRAISRFIMRDESGNTMGSSY
ncbi:reverse transcriptase [Gossypium australe]|uniref:Reverse transcriptase n=1 Tax=Gossypium australe TaxID=47621 RepID=A0A5B6VBX4_9ROSI|nr:reverse transcriptase [Gossypium australe]